MPLLIRPATPADYPALHALVIAAFEPITWQTGVDATFGPLNGLDWRTRWALRLDNIFQTQIVLVGEENGAPAALATAALDRAAALALIDVLAVGPAFQGRGYGRAMLRGMLDHLRQLGMQHVQLDCLTTNAVGNALYESEGFVEVARHIRWFRKLE
jgi:ribosomal protein S18 acetylase RimI-like enzyme